ncbi:MAG: phosphoribosylglycinamide formyltransferase [Leptospirillum sp.]
MTDPSSDKGADLFASARKLRIAIFASGSGTNAEAIIRACQKGDDGPLPMVDPVVVICDKPGARVLDRAKSLNIPSLLFPSRDFASRESHEKAILEELSDLSVDAVALAGYMRIIGKSLIEAFPGKILNIHPSLLPSFPGMAAHRQAIDYGVRFTGVTVHVVDEGMDTGPIILQKVEPVLEGDTESTLSERMRPLEHQAYIESLSFLSRGTMRIVGRKVFLDDHR